MDVRGGNETAGFGEEIALQELTLRVRRHFPPDHPLSGHGMLENVTGSRHGPLLSVPLDATGGPSPDQSQ
jgi:hypothetical protein